MSSGLAGAVVTEEPEDRSRSARRDPGRGGPQVTELLPEAPGAVTPLDRVPEIAGAVERARVAYVVFVHGRPTLEEAIDLGPASSRGP